MTDKPRKAILIDVDHTLSDASWRDQWIGQWEVYHELSSQDQPVRDMIDMVAALRATHFAPIVGLTARPERWRKVTMDWLMKHAIVLDELIMRPDKDFRPSAKLKLALAKERFQDLVNEVAFILDDRADVLELFKAEGVNCLMIYGMMHKDYEGPVYG